MYQLAKTLFLRCETPLHAGSGDDLGIVDLPIQREKHNNYPKVEGSSLKGALRDAFERKLDSPGNDKDKQVLSAFGPSSDDNISSDTSHAGCLGFSDARLLLFPVKTMKGVFAWVTCPLVLDRFSRDLSRTDENLKIANIPSPSEGEVIPMGQYGSSTIWNKTKVLIEEYAFTVISVDNKPSIGGENLATWLATQFYGKGKSAGKDKMELDILILSNDDFKAFVSHSTEIITRIAIDSKTGTVKEGALFTEEFLPTESILYSLVLAAPSFQAKKIQGEELIFNDAQKAIGFFEDTLKQQLKETFQLGANAGIGKGIMLAKLLS